MSTVIRPEISEKNEFYISKHRYYELKHFALQYPLWKKAYSDIDGFRANYSVLNGTFATNVLVDVTAKYAMMKTFYAYRIDMVERAAMDADEDLWPYILRGVTEGRSYTYLKTKLDMPCSRDTYYNRFRKFFYLLSEYRD